MVIKAGQPLLPAERAWVVMDEEVFVVPEAEKLEPNTTYEWYFADAVMADDFFYPDPLA